MNWFWPGAAPKSGSTATPSRPRSEFEQIWLDGKVSAEVLVPGVKRRTISSPLWRVIRSRPSGVNAIAVGPLAAVTSSSTKLGGSAAEAAEAGRSAARNRAFGLMATSAVRRMANVESRIRNSIPDSPFRIPLHVVPQHVEHEV